MGLRPTQGDENRVKEGLVRNYTNLCHLDRSAAEWRDLRFAGCGRSTAFAFLSVIPAGNLLFVSPRDQKKQNRSDSMSVDR